ncbi:hypothetical protein H5410_008337 [Solanum commersonii]|uniref:Uncharacterized protein n=1 Tax=Solanum commersonii TaxID=4109 RepID=A0A9J6AGH8_SOLCO|nr:hypothetical protein H5410_008337 [Solanum commersonii]
MDVQAMDTSKSAAPAMNGRRRSAREFAGTPKRMERGISTSFTAKTGEGESICDFAGKNGDDAGDGFLLVVK